MWVHPNLRVMILDHGGLGLLGSMPPIRFEHIIVSNLMQKAGMVLHYSLHGIGWHLQKSNQISNTSNSNPDHHRNISFQRSKAHLLRSYPKNHSWFVCCMFLSLNLSTLAFCRSIFPFTLSNAATIFASNSFWSLLVLKISYTSSPN